MTSKTSILLIIQQQPGIEYPTILSKIAPNYANLNSARAALSRVLKDAISFGHLQKKGHSLFLTDKGTASLKVRMHDKLVLKLNQLMRVRSVASNPDALMQHLSILLERGKIDPRLIDNARASVSFSVGDLEHVHQQLQQHIQHLSYVEKTLGTQLGSLKELNFPSSLQTKTIDMLPHLPSLMELSHTPEFQLEHPHTHLAEQPNHPLLAGLSATPKGSRVSIPIQQLPLIMQRVRAQDTPTHPLRAYIGMYHLEFDKEKTILRGPANGLKDLLAHSAATTQSAREPDSPSPPEEPFPAPEPGEPESPTIPNPTHPHPETPAPTEPDTPPEEPYPEPDSPEEPEEPNEPREPYPPAPLMERNPPAPPKQ